MNEKILSLRKKANNLPLLPGVYIMKNSVGEVIYVGKAKKLKNRVVGYFRTDANHTTKVRKMVANVNDFDYIVCDTEFEALTLENSLIKQYSPKYNILLKDDKGYHYIKISRDKWRKITAVKQLDKNGTFIGPYNSAFVVGKTVKEALKIFKLPDCNRSFDKYSKPCLNYHIGLCMAPCRAKTTLTEYNEAVDAAIDFIKNDGADNLAELRKKMEAASEELNFEYAAKLRDRIRSIERVHEKQKVILTDTARHDVFATALAGETACVQTLVFTNGHLSDERHFFFEGIASKEELYNEFLVQYYSIYNDIPRRIIIDALPEDNAVIDFISSKSDRSLEVLLPQRADKLKLLNMCKSNAAEHLAQRIERSIKETSSLNTLADILGLKNVPRYIEAYDVSNMAGSENVAAMVVFRDGRPDKNLYRKFKIKSFVGQDDFGSLAEVIDRRFNEYEKGEDEAFKNLPDLILLDGGLPQLNAVMPILKKHNLEISIFGMVKDNKHKTNAIASSGGNIAIKSNRAAFTLVTAIQDEVHRVAIGYHKARRSKTMLESELLKIEGIGKGRANSLMRHFKTLNKIKAATKEELLKVSGIGEKHADSIIKYFAE